MERSELVYEVRKLLKEMKSGDDRLQFIEEIMEGCCLECGDELYGNKCYCTCNE